MISGQLAVNSKYAKYSVPYLFIFLYSEHHQASLFKELLKLFSHWFISFSEFRNPDDLIEHRTNLAQFMIILHFFESIFSMHS